MGTVVNMEGGEFRATHSRHNRSREYDSTIIVRAVPISYMFVKLESNGPGVGITRDVRC